MRAAKRAVVLSVLAASVVAFGVGCGGSSSSNSTDSSSPSSPGFSKYETEMQALGVQLGAELARLGQSNVGVPPKVIAQHLVAVQVQLRSTADKLAAITPPEAIKADHALLLKGVREYANGLDPLIVKLRAPTSDKLAYLAILRTIASLKGVKDMQNASLAITKAGYLITLKG
jgi:hypothetical protein